MEQLSGKTAIVTGASSGIGAAIAREIVKEGGNVVLAARRTEKLAELERELVKYGNSKVLSVQTDVTKNHEVEALVKQAEQKFQQIDFFINNAGQMLTAPIRSGKVEEWETMIDVNIKGVIFGINAVLPTMIERSNGHIINVCSVAGFEVTKASTVYSATKYAVRAISAGLEKELARTGVRVTNISPGMVDTSLTSNSGGHNERKKLETKDIAKAVIYAVTQPSYVNVNEITVRPV
ncbi:oxidoreductase [Gracilibacillus boraciitolerans JCM 21714]|uniref:Oxidoreductase n=1 Tax=Gracilibacillus boraciitolerans JCM 21714 TaxID=1298598 RepID=W4VD15_9BACI|nr:SDR family oxidoreductase [Gracilibacillus boraciitolerans]GAE91092.1 oxidoreductase [Gracilibacillus boraciitolerans JCM 21714]